jgi:hypothetical protein
MDDIKLKRCWEHWQNLAPHVQERSTAKHLLAAIEIADRLLRENDRLTIENQNVTKTCDQCGGAGPLKRGWTGAFYCSESCERKAVSRLYNSMPGGPNPYPGWMPMQIDKEIKRRWAKDS